MSISEYFPAITVSNIYYQFSDANKKATKNSSLFIV